MSKQLPLIYGFNKTSEAGIDNSEPSIFVGGCNMRCPYCMNKKIVLMDDPTLKPMDITPIKEYVIDNKCKLLMVSGGEVTIKAPELLHNLIDEVESWGCKVGISTNGLNTHGLYGILPRLAYVALDYKTNLVRYPEISHKVYHPIEQLLGSWHIIRNRKATRKDSDPFNYEIRTTLYPTLVDPSTIHEIGNILLKGQAEKWVLQQFRHTKVMLDENARKVDPYTEEQVIELCKIADLYTENVVLRYV